MAQSVGFFMQTRDTKIMLEELERQYAGLRAKVHDLREYL